MLSLAYDSFDFPKFIIPHWHTSADRFEQGQKRRRYFAHYDWQSTLFSFRDALVGMETLKRKNTPSGASKAAALAGD